MKKIDAIVRSSCLEEIKQALHQIDINGLTVSQVMGFGTQKGWKEYYRDTEIILNMVPKLKLEMVVRNEVAQKVVDAIVKTARTGEVGDGKIFIYDVSDAIRIRTGQTGEDAI